MPSADKPLFARAFLWAVLCGYSQPQKMRRLESKKAGKFFANYFDIKMLNLLFFY